MKKLTFIAAFISVIFLPNGVFAQAGDGNSAVIKVEKGAEPVIIGNKFCPVSGRQIDEESAVTYEYQGKVYNFCSEACVEEFIQDPERYIKIVEEELKTRALENFEQQREEWQREPEPVSGYHQEHLY